MTMYGTQAMTTSWMPLYQQLFLLAHDSDGTPRLAADAMGLALSGATIAELALSENLRADADRIYVHASAPPHPDPLAAAVVTALLRADGGRQLTYWLRMMAADMTDRVSGGLLAAGLVKRETRRREVRYLPTDPNVVQQRLGILREATYGRTAPAAPTLVLAGFFAMLRLHDHLYLNIGGGELLDILTGLFRRCDPRIQHIVVTTGQLITDAGMRAYH
jgi:hypothetical protein